MVERDRLQVRLEQKSQTWNVPWYAAWSRFARLSEKGRATEQLCVNFSFGHKNTTASTQQLPLYSAKLPNRHLWFRFQVDAKGFLTRVRKNISSDQRARFVAPFEKSAAHYDWIQLHALNDTRTTGRATYTRKRYIASIVEFTLILLCVRSTMLERQHVQHCVCAQFSVTSVFSTCVSQREHANAYALAQVPE